jgi:hypothetical protein
VFGVKTSNVSYYPKMFQPWTVSSPGAFVILCYMYVVGNAFSSPIKANSLKITRLHFCPSLLALVVSEFACRTEDHEFKPSPESKRLYKFFYTLQFCGIWLTYIIRIIIDCTEEKSLFCRMHFPESNILGQSVVFYHCRSFSFLQASS